MRDKTVERDVKREKERYAIERASCKKTVYVCVSEREREREL